MLLTRELNETIRRSEIAAVRRSFDAARHLRPDAGFASLDVAGGFARFVGTEPALSSAFGIGTLAPVGAEDVATITSFFESRGATPRIYVSPLANLTLPLELAAAGYAPVDYDNVLVSDDFEKYGARDERIRIAPSLGAWARASTDSFAGCEPRETADDFVALTVASAKGVTVFEAIDNGAVVATSAMHVDEGNAAFFAASVSPAHRRRGWHTAMIRDRIARARDAGARFMRATANVDTTSERNFHRCGFTTLYTRCVWERRSR